MPIDTQQIMQEAEKLGQLVAQHPAVGRYKDAQRAVSQDPDAGRLLADFDRQLESLARQEQSGMPVTDAQRMQLEALQSRIVSHLKIKALNLAQVEFVDGQVRSGSRRVALTDAAKDGEIVAEDRIEYGDLDKQYQQSTFGAHFAEVGVDRITGEMRVRRMLAVCSAGRILNPKAARSQVIGAMTMGVGAALMEELAVDKRFGFFVNHDLASYEVPVHADIPHQEVIFLDETDPISSPMKAKGVGELGICGVGAAVANAIYNATGARVRDYPITLDKLFAKLTLPA